MAKTQDGTNKQKPTQTLTKKITKKLKTKADEPEPAEAVPETEPQASTYSDSDSDCDPDKLPKLLEPYSKEQLIALICTSAQKNPFLYSVIREAADRDVTHRKIFVHGLGWDTTLESLVSAFEPFGEIEDCNVVTDKVTGKAKGYGFVLFKTRKGAEKALRDPRKKISNRIASWQLASLGPVASSAKDLDVRPRKIYVSNVPKDADPDSLRACFGSFGEIETGPIGFDASTGKSRGYAMFVYKTVEGAKKALEEPYVVYEGHQLYCQKAADGKGKNSVAQAVTQGQQPHGQVLAAMAAAQNMAMFGQQPGLNSVYGGLLGYPEAAGGGLINPVLAGALSQGPLNIGMVSQGLVGASQVNSMVGLGGGNQSVLGAYGRGQGLQHAYPNAQIGQAGVGRGQGASGSFAGYPSYMWS